MLPFVGTPTILSTLRIWRVYMDKQLKICMYKIYIRFWVLEVFILSSPLVSYVSG